jgi:hypothetical protein
MKKILLLGIFLASAVNGCGGAGSGATELKTSYVTASARSASLDADVVKYVDPLLGCVPGNVTIPPLDTVTVDVASTPYPGSDVRKLPIRINSATVTYSPIPYSGYVTPPIEPDIQQFAGITLPYGTTYALPVTVLRQSQKEIFINELCAGPTYHYNVSILINVSEIGTDADGTAETAMQLNVANFADK